MPLPLPEPIVQHASNPHARRDLRYGERQRRVLDSAECEAARREIASWPGYAPTPVLSLAGLAARSGCAKLWYKDEAGRFGLGSFKSLGGAFAVARILIAEIERRSGQHASVADLLAGRYRDLTRTVTVTCATDGNHGRSVAWGARQFGCQCVIYIHATVSKGRQQAIEAYGAEVVRTAGNYDDAVRAADRDAERLGRIVVSDTSYPGYMDIPRTVMQGYTVLADEAIEQLAAEGGPTHVFLQGGVGGFAAAVIARYWERLGARRPRCIVVEPDQAACIFASVRAGKPVAITGALDTMMAGLACGEVSLLAWEILDQGMDDALMIPDAAAIACMRLLADGGGDPPVVAGESAVAGLAGALGALQREDLRAALELERSSRVLVIGTEGATDPELYRQLVGRGPQEVRAT
ncbi:MAG: diaminopropionate ammonia-lyase [Gammaproteobacteria bacterium]